MPKLFFIFFSLIASGLASVGVVVALVAGVAQLVPLLGAPASGAIAAVPLTWFVSRRLDTKAG